MSWVTVLLTLLFYSRPLCCCCSVTQPCLTLSDPMDFSAPGFPVFHHLLELAQTHVHWVSDAIQPSHPLSSSSPSAFYLYYLCRQSNVSTFNTLSRFVIAFLLRSKHLFISWLQSLSAVMTHEQYEKSHSAVWSSLDARNFTSQSHTNPCWTNSWDLKSNYKYVICGAWRIFCAWEWQINVILEASKNEHFVCWEVVNSSMCHWKSVYGNILLTRTIARLSWNSVINNVNRNHIFPFFLLKKLPYAVLPCFFFFFFLV